MTFLTEDILKGTDWRALERAVARLMGHCGWREVSIVGRSGDRGADIVAIREEQDGKRRTWVVQVKAITGGHYVGIAALNEVLQAQGVYSAHVVAVATNGDFTDSVIKRQKTLVESGFEVKLWNGSFLKKLLERWNEKHNLARPLREYQEKIATRALEVFESGEGKVQYVVATGLGKTVIAADIAARLWARGCRKMLVLCHARELALQLEQGFWSQLGKSVPTRYFFDGFPPIVYDGINFGLYQSLQGYLGGINSGSFDAVIVDEAHHALAHGFRSCVDHLAPKFLVGMTATPWRGDSRSLDELFGEPIARISLADGMAMGFLAKVDYRLYCDNIDWQAVPNLTNARLTIRDLNKRLFLPQRDEAIIREILAQAAQLSSPRIAIFSPSIEHARRFAAMISANGIPCKPLSGEENIERRKRLMDFSVGKLKAVTAVDVMNEGIDVPDVNILVFLRATHSRRIFVQQLGRGLRLAPDKEKVVVLDLVSDIRRLAEVLEFNKEVKQKSKKFENVFLQDGVVQFNNSQAQKFIEAWLSDMTDLSNAEDSEKLAFPAVEW